MAFRIIEKDKIKLKMPDVSKVSGKSDKEINNEFAKHLAIFEAAGRERKTKNIVKWGENRQYYMRTMFYLYLFSRYKQSCVITLQPDCTYLPDICQKNGDIIYAMYTFKLTGSKATRYAQYRKMFIKEVAKCLKKKDLVVVPLRLYFQGEGAFANSAYGSTHANLLIFRKKQKTIEVFEPHGQNFGGSEALSVREAYMEFANDFNIHSKLSYTPLMSDQVCPTYRGLQSLEGYSSVTRALGEGGGYCSVWSMFMTEIIFKNPTVPTSEVLQGLFDMMGHKDNNTYNEKNTIGNYLHMFMRGYASYISKKVAKYNTLIFGDESMNAIKLGNKNVNYAALKVFRDNFKLYLDLNAEAILKDISFTQLKKQISKRKRHTLFTEYGKERTMEFLDKMIIQENQGTYTPVVNPRDTVERIKSLQYNSPCPPGKIRSDKTGNCIKARTKVQKNTVKNRDANKKMVPKKVCPPGKFYNEKTKRCNKIKPTKPQKVKIAKKPIKAKKTSPQKNAPTPKPILKNRKRCPNGTRRNPITKECEKKNKTQKKLKLKIVKKLGNTQTIKVKKLGKIKLKTRKRCPNGSRKDSKTGKCVPYKRT